MITVVVEGWEYPEATLSRLGEQISGYTDYQGIISARIVAAREIRQWNAAYADTDAATDVLSFAYAEDRPATETNPETPLGDVLISHEHIHEQAAQAGTGAGDECLLLLTHGCLHVLGFDHQSKSQQQRMEALHVEIMQKLGYDEPRQFSWHAS